MNFTLYLRTPHGDHFLQKAGSSEDLQKSHATIVRWVSQMSLYISNPAAASLVIAKNGYGILEAKYVAGGRRAWRDLTTVAEMTIKPPLDEAA